MKDWDGFIDFKESNAGQYYEMYDDFGIEEMKSVRKLIYDTYGNEPNYILVRYEIKGGNVKWYTPDVSKRVVQYTKEWDKIGEFDSLIDAWKALWIHASVIWRVCKWYRKSAWGYKWQFQ